MRGDLTIARVTDLAALSNVNEVSGTLAIEDSPQLRTLEGLERLEVAREIALRRLPSLESAVELSSLRRLWALTIQEAPKLTELEAPSGVHRLDKLEIRNTALRSLSRGWEVSEVGELKIVGNPRLVSTRGLNKVVRVGSLTVASNRFLLGDKPELFPQLAHCETLDIEVTLGVDAEDRARLGGCLSAVHSGSLAMVAR